MVAMVRIDPRGESSVWKGVNPDPDKVRTSNTCSLVLWSQVGYLWIYSHIPSEILYRAPSVVPSSFPYHNHSSLPSSVPSSNPLRDPSQAPINKQSRLSSVVPSVEPSKDLRTVPSYVPSVPTWVKGPIRYFGIFHKRVLGSRPHFQKLENFRKRNIYMFSPTCGSGFSRCQLMVESPGVLLRRTRSLVPHVRQLRVPFC